MGRTFVAANHDIVSRTGVPVSAYPFTMATWVYPTSFATDTWPMIGVRVTSGDGYYAIGILNGSACRAQIDFQNFISATIAQTSTGLISLNAWAHLCVVFKSGANGARIYINATQRASVTNNETFPTPDTFTAGGDVPNNTRYFAGILAEQGVWNVELTDLEIKSLASGMPPSRVRRTALVLYWPFHGIGSPEPDLSGHGRTGTVTAPVRGNHPPVTSYAPMG